MNTNDNLYPTNISEIIKNFSSMIRNFSIKETEWAIEKENYEKKVSELEGQISAHENINIDLLKRIRMLEYELARERNEKGINNKNNDNKSSDNNNALFKDLQYPNLLKEEDLKFLEEESKKPSLLNILNSIGINERLANNLFTDFELNRTELENLIQQDLEEKLKDIENDTKSDKVNLQNIKEMKEQYQNKMDNDGKNNNNKSKVNDKNTSDKQNKISPQKVSSEVNSAYSKTPNIQTNFNLNNFLELRSHFDEVRKLSYLSNINTLISVSEDCLIKAWSLNSLHFNTQLNDIEPYLHLRGHTGPLFCVENGKDNLIYTGGNEGVIQIWNILSEKEINQFGSSDDLYSLNVGYFQNNEENEIYWELKHHPKQNLLISLSSDCNISFWETKTVEEFVNEFSNGRFKWMKNSIVKKSNFFPDENCVPTVCEFVKQDNNKLLVGFNDASISIVDINKGNFCANYDTYEKKGKKLNKDLNDRVLCQPNCFAACETIPVIYGGFENSTIKILDLRDRNANNTNNLNNKFDNNNILNFNNLNNKNMDNNSIITDVINAHGDAVTSLNLYKDLYLFSVSHDTTIKIWDTRKMNEPINTTVCSQKKWDEAMWDSLLIEKTMTFCVACADSTIKLYQL